VAGSAACLHDDLAGAWKNYPEAPVIAVNGAAKEVAAFALYSIHIDRFESHRWVHHQKRKFDTTFSTHSRNLGADYLWSIRGGGGSAWDARKVAALIGFDLVILCGCPMEPGPYVGNHNIGGYMHVDTIVNDLRRGIESDTGWHKGVYSMSGWTREVLGDLP
jgi:hypothetical protein